MAQAVGRACFNAVGCNARGRVCAARQPSCIRVLQRPPIRRPRHFLSKQPRKVLVCATANVSLAEAQTHPKEAEFPGTAGVYAVYDGQGTLQYVGLTRKISFSVATHREALPELVHTVRYIEIPGGDKESLTEMWKAWVSEAVESSGDVPPGNKRGETKWQQGQRRAKSEIRLTPGKGLQDLTCSVEDLIDAVVKTNKVVAFVKGSRRQPSCGFSYKVLTILNEVGADYEVVNVLDEVYNPGVREAIKNYSQWPTIPQIFVHGEFVGGADILEQMHSTGELRKLILGES